MASSSSSTTSATDAQFQAYYLQRATAELAEDLDTLRTAEDFKTGAAAAAATAAAAAAAASDGNGKEDGNSKNRNAGARTGTGASVHPLDNPLQVLIGALRQGADMFSAADKQRVATAAAADKEEDAEKQP